MLFRSATVFIDGLYLSGGWTFLVARNPTHVIAWQWAGSESAAAYSALLTPIAPPDLVTTDGAGGALKALHALWPDTPIQRCLIHIHCDTRRDLTRNPITTQGKALLAHSRKLLKITTPFWVKKKYYDKISKMELSYFCGGDVTASGLFDILMSIDMGYGSVSTYYKFGQYIKENNSSMTKYLSYFDKNFYCKPFVNNEIVDVANTLDIDEVHFNNLYYDEKRYLSLKDIHTELSEKNISWKDAKSILTNKLDSINNSDFDGTLYKIEIEGKKSGRDRLLTLEITATESYTISAYILYKVIEELFRDYKLDAGKIRPFELIDSEMIFREMIEHGMIKNISKNKDIEYDVGSL